MLRQTDDRLFPAINKYGCLFISILKHNEDLGSSRFSTPEQINDLWADMKMSGAINSDNLIVWKDFLEEADLPFAYGGKLGKDYVLRYNERAILEMYNPATKFTHFVVGKFADDANKYVVDFDPIENSITVRDGYLQKVRVLVVI